MTTETDAKRWVGTGVRRKEDNRLLTGRGKFTDDIDLPGQLYCSILRSPYAHARIVSIDTSAALALEGVVAVLTGADAAQISEPLPPAIDLATKHAKPYAIAVDKVRFYGEPLRLSRRRPATSPRTRSSSSTWSTRSCRR
jgi:CO/xanthine dehydrogenase Mo-binding subunit